MTFAFVLPKRWVAYFQRDALQEVRAASRLTVGTGRIAGGQILWCRRGRAPIGATR
jgi:hypothetical protein